MIPNRIYFVLLSLMIFCGCAKEKNIYDSIELRNEIEELIVQIIELDSIDEYYPNYGIFKVLPKYVNQNEKETFKPGPPPGSNYLFPDLEYEFKDSEVRLTNKDKNYLKTQELDSKRIELSDDRFGGKKTDIKIRIPYVYFSIPIFNSERNLAWIKTGLVCGGLCGEGRTLILKKNNGKWIIIMGKTDWVS